MTEIRAAQFPEHSEAVRAIFREYAESLGVDLSFQSFDAELAELPGMYAAPHGRVLLAWHDGEVAGCVALRPLDEGACEMKRLYVRPAGRGQQLGRRLVDAIIQAAKETGYTKIRLDTLPHLQTALHIYDTLGFVRIPAYVFNPIEGVAFLELDLLA